MFMSTSAITTLSLHDALPTFDSDKAFQGVRDLVMYDIPDGTRSTLSVPVTGDVDADAGLYCLALVHTLASLGARTDRKSTRLNSSHGSISYAVFCLKKKNNIS